MVFNDNMNIHPQSNIWMLCKCAINTIMIKIKQWGKKSTAIHCNTLQHTATHYNTPQHTGGSTLQHTATHFLLQRTQTFSVTCVTWLIHMCAMTHSYIIAHYSYVCDMTHAYADDIAGGVVGCVSMWVCVHDMTQSYVWHDSTYVFDLLDRCVHTCVHLPTFSCRSGGSMYQLSCCFSIQPADVPYKGIYTSVQISVCKFI